MDNNQELIKTVYQNAQMSKDILNKLIKVCDDANFRSALADEFAQYHEIVCAAEEICNEMNFPVKTSKHMKNAIFSGMSINIMIDKTSSHLAEMMVQGSIMGVIDMKRALKECTGAGENIKALAQKLLETEQNNSNKMLEFV